MGAGRASHHPSGTRVKTKIVIRTAIPPKAPAARNASPRRTVRTRLPLRSEGRWPGKPPPQWNKSKDKDRDKDGHPPKGPRGEKRQSPENSTNPPPPQIGRALAGQATTPVEQE